MKINSAHSRQYSIKSGYTLIELLITMTIVTIVFTIGLVSFRDFSRRQALTGILKSVKADLRLAQQYALTGKKPLDCDSSYTLSGYTFDITGDYSYDLVANCTNGALTNNVIVKSVDLSVNEVKISTSPAIPDSVLFKVLGQGTDLTGPLTINFVHDFAGTSGNIVVGTGGDVE